MLRSLRRRAFGRASLLQAGEAPAGSRARLRKRLALLARLARSRRWIVGTVLTLGGWLPHASAFRLAPVTIVQPALAFTLVVVLLGAHTARRTSRSELAR